MDDALSRLIAFGCSLTYGFGLPDCYVSDMQHGPNPSVHAWPALTATALKLDIVNKAISGASNLKILNEILNFDFNIEDTVIILWSFYQHNWC